MDKHTKRSVPISKLFASEAQTLRGLALIKDMSILLQSAPLDGAAALLERAKLLELGKDSSIPNQMRLRETLEQVQAYLADIGGHNELVLSIGAVLEGA